MLGLCFHCASASEGHCPVRLVSCDPGSGPCTIDVDGKTNASGLGKVDVACASRSDGGAFGHGQLMRPAGVRCQWQSHDAGGDNDQFNGRCLGGNRVRVLYLALMQPPVRLWRSVSGVGVVKAVKLSGMAIVRMILVARLMLALLAAAGMAFSSAAQAQSTPPDGAIGWQSGYGGGAYPSADAACHAQWQQYAATPDGRFIGAFPSDDWRIQNCQWTTFQNGLCDLDHPGAGIGPCTTVLPSVANVVCASGLIPTVDGHCRKNPPVEKSCPTCDAARSGGVGSGGSEPGRSNPTVGNPIVLSTGAKRLDATDYASADGLFTIGRHYRSFQVGPPLIFGLLPRSNPRWLVAGWNFDFGYELQLGTFSGSVAAPGANVEAFVYAPDGTGYGFVLQPSGQWVIDPVYGAANAQNNWKLQYVGTLPADLSTVTKAPSTWKLTDGDDNVWILKTNMVPNGGSYVYGWPTQKTTRDGYQWNFAYNTDSSLASITDSFGRTAKFTWAQFRFTSAASPPAGFLPLPVAVTSIALPDGTSLVYTYNPPPATTGASTSRATTAAIGRTRIS